MNNVIQSIVIAFRGIGANKLRAFLTMLGIVIGIAAVLTMMSVGRGMELLITKQLEAMGTTLIMVRSGMASLTFADAEAIGDPAKVPHVELVAPIVTDFAPVVAGGETMHLQIQGISPEFAVVRNLSLARGEFITHYDLQARAMVCLLGSMVAEQLFPGGCPIGQSVRIEGRNFRVIGILESKGGVLGMGMGDRTVMIPITTAMYRVMPQRDIRGEHLIGSIYVLAANEEVIDPAMEQIDALLRERHRDVIRERPGAWAMPMGPGNGVMEMEYFWITSAEALLEGAGEIAMIITIFLSSIAGIALLVGGIGIMNIMLVSVTERTREIGIRKAMGAKRRDILLQFLMESATLTLFGGLIGVLMAWGLSQLIAWIATAAAGQPLTPVMAPDIIILAVSVAVAIGLFFGIYPAMRAARLNPIDALRYE